MWVNMSHHSTLVKCYLLHSIFVMVTELSRLSVCEYRIIRSSLDADGMLECTVPSWHNFDQKLYSVHLFCTHMLLGVHLLAVRT